MWKSMLKPWKTAWNKALDAGRAAKHRPGSHSSATMRTGIAALDDSIAERGRFGKTAERDNEALKREKCNAYPYKTGVQGGE